MVKKNKEIVGLYINNKSLKCSYTNQENNQFSIKLQKYNFTNSEIQDLNIYNSNKIGQYIKSFLNNNNIKDPIFIIVLENKKIIENINTDLIINKNLYHEIEQTFFLKQEKISYKTAIDQSNLLQFKLLIHNHRLNLASLTTPIPVLYQLYKSLHIQNQVDNNLTLKSLKSFFINSCNLEQKKLIVPITCKNNYDYLIALGIYYVCQNI